MIAMISVRQTADKPNFPLRPLAVFTGSSMTLGVVDVPPTRESIAVTGVSLAVENAVGAVVSASAVESGGVWTATIPASHFAAVGVVTVGVTISASGTDENGTARSWIIGKGDLSILPADGVPVPGETLQNVHLRDAVPATPLKGDLCEGANGWQIYTGEEWAVISPDLSNYATKADATLTERTGYTDWQYSRLTVVGPNPQDWVWTYEPPQYSNGTWTTEITNGPDFLTVTAQGGEGATSLTFTTASGAAVTASGSATRTALQSYQLGSQASKPLASEVEVAALWTAVAAKYTKPSGGIPKSDLASGVQTSLDKADTALQAHQQLGIGIAALHWEISSVAMDLTINWDTSNKNWVLKQDGAIVSYDGEGNAESLSLFWAAADNTLGVDVTATRQMAGWTLGTQADKPLATAAQGALAQTAVQPSALPLSEMWTFEVDDGQGGTTTVTKSVAVYAAGANS